MDFELFMERYGYTILFGIFIAIVAAIFGIVLLWVYSMFKILGIAAIAMIGGYLIFSYFIKRRYLDAHGEALGKYFYDPKYGKKRY